MAVRAVTRRSLSLLFFSNVTTGAKRVVVYLFEEKKGASSSSPSRNVPIALFTRDYI